MTESTAAPLLLIVEDDTVLRERLARALIARGYDVRQASDIPAARAAITPDAPEFVVLDLRMPGGHGLELIPELLAADAATKIVVLTGYGSVATALEAVRLGAVHYLTKPADADEIVAAFSRDTHAQIPDASHLQPMSLDRVEWEHISRVLVDCDHNISEAARVLGIHRRSLQRKLTKYPPGR